jgi:hypothetical protein
VILLNAVDCIPASYQGRFGSVRRATKTFFNMILAGMTVSDG